jgi:hypothetical protein
MRIVHIRITQLGEGSFYPETYIITEILTEENAGSQFGPVQFRFGIQVTKIMCGANTHTKFPFLHYGILGKNSQGQAIHNQGQKFSHICKIRF